MVTTLTEYENEQLAALNAWRDAPPSLGIRGFHRASNRVTRALGVAIPVNALRSALNGTDQLANRFTGTAALCRRAGVREVEELRDQPLEVCDQLARRVRRQALLVSAGTGAITGVGGALGATLDVPALLALSLHTIHRTAECYGFRIDSSQDRRYSIGVFALASANSDEEKRLAISALDGLHAELDDAAWRDGIERAAERELSKDFVVFSVQRLARSLGIHLGRRKAASALPIIGAAVGGSVNAWYMNDLARSARFAMLARWYDHRGYAATAPAALPSSPTAEGS